MYINPQTNIRLLRGCPLDPSYVHSVAFLDATTQTNYFMGLTKYNLNNYSYQRYGKGKLRVQLLADNLYDVNYMMFQNTIYGTKWFYAFVDRVEYINDVTTEIEYHIDEIQTWLFDWSFNQCFIERMHTLSDEVGDNIVVEPVEVGEYVYNNYSQINKFNMTYCIIVGIVDVSATDGAYIADGKMYDGIYGGLSLYAFSQSNITGVNDLINLYSRKDPNSVVTIYMCPRDAINDTQDIDSLQPLTPYSFGTSYRVELNTCGTTIDGHTVRNKKLLTYPFNFENVVNGQGENLALRYEFFGDHNDSGIEHKAQVWLLSNISEPVQLVCCPNDYKGVYADSVTQIPNQPKVDEKIVLTGFPQCSWNADSWKMWLSQNAVPILINAVTTGATVALNSYNSATPDVAKNVYDFATGNQMDVNFTRPASFKLKENTAIYALHQISGLLTSSYKASIAADQSKGNISSSNALFTAGEYCFHHGRMSVNQHQAEIIDSFFDRFGYAINKIDTPSIRNRPAWTYLKTIDCTIDGNIPVDSEHEIESIINNGITFWTNPLYVADYTRNNQPIT